MTVIRYTDSAGFLQRVRPMLEWDEAANGIFLGLAGRLCKDATAYGNQPPYLALVESDEAGNDQPAAIGMMTPPHALLVQSIGKEEARSLALLASDLADSPWTVPGVNGPSHIAKIFADIWAEQHDVVYQTGMELRTFKLTEVDHPTYSPGHFRCAEMTDLERIVDWAQAFTGEAIGNNEPFDSDRARTRFAGAIEQGTVFFWDDDGPVSIASCGRPSAHGIAVNMVYTPHHLRGRGYASSCVAALSQRLLDDGWQFCTLFTNLANPTSNSVYQRIGYRPICDFTHYLFG